MSLAENTAGYRQVEPHWNSGMIVASIAVSLLGAFTSTQLMCQARVSANFFSLVIWTILGSLTFGFCSIWSLHFVAMLACELDLPIGVNVPLTILSSILAVFFTFVALAGDLLWERHTQGRGGSKRRKSRQRPKDAYANGYSRGHSHKSISGYSPTPLLDHIEHDDEEYNSYRDHPEQVGLLQSSVHELDEQLSCTEGDHDPDSCNISPQTSPQTANGNTESTLLGDADSATSFELQRTSSENSVSQRSASFVSSNASSYGLANIMNIAYRSTSPAKNAFIATGEALYTGCTVKNIIKGFFWSLAITGMHYVGIEALRVPRGFLTLDPILVILSALISWAVCLVGCILLSQIESRLAQQFLFSAVASGGVAAMHFTGMGAVTFWSRDPPSEKRGYPPALAVAIVSIAITTCIGANGLLAHVATVSRNELAEIVWTRRKLWRTIAQKENAEAAAAARSDFIASASHEIRTPLHHLQGYSDLLSKTELTEEGRMLLYSIQHATKTLSLITNNVLDWSKLERDSENSCRPISLDMRTVCESILVLLPNKDDEAEVELMMVVTPEVPHSLFLDETYIHRILMNLLSNALKFTRSGYILLLIEMKHGKIVATVKDTGMGIPPSFLPQLFEPFKQAQTRGSQRGTGLGLSIILQLLQKMQGSITVDSKHVETQGVEAGQTGSTFTITIPVQTADRNQRTADPMAQIAILPGENERALEGLRTAWQKSGFKAVLVERFSDLDGYDWKYIWADLSWLREHPVDLRQLLERDQWTVLVPYDTQDALQQIPGIMSAPHFAPLQKPLIWHSFAKQISAAKEPANKAVTSRTVRFAPEPKIAGFGSVEHVESQGSLDEKKPVILLVEDNPINQKLGKKMLGSLGYQVLLADDGQEAIQQMLKHDATVDAILMDQSMPRKDGVTATREIRAMEAAGRLSRRRLIIAVTAVVDSQAQALFKAAGADDFLAKPLSMGRLEQTLAAHLPPTRRKDT